MAEIYDEEDLLKSLHSFVKSNLNAKITAINTEKGDYLLSEITEDDRHFVYAGDLTELPNHVFVNFAIDGDIEVKNNYNDMVSLPLLRIEIVFDDPQRANTYFKSLRYMRALYETLLEYEASAIEVDGFTLTKAIPMIVDSGHRKLVVSGVSLSVALG